MSVACKNGCSPLATLLAYFPYMDFIGGKLVSSIIVNIPYLLALTLSIKSSNI